MKEPSSEDGSEEQREGTRLEHPVMVAYRTVDQFLCDFGTNISLSGIFINTPEPLEVGTAVRILISLPEAEVPELHGRVARVQAGAPGEDPGMGIEFQDVDEQTAKTLERVVEGLKEQLDHAGGQ